MQSQGVNHITYDATNLNHVSNTADVKAVAAHALRNIPDSDLLIKHVFETEHNIEQLPRPRVRNMKYYDPFAFGR